MKNDRWKQVSEVFEAAISREPKDRQQFIAVACGGDKTLLKQVDALVSAHEKAEAGGFIDMNAVEFSAPMLVDEEDLSDQRIAHYNVTERIGSGGMGAVYLARDERLERLVALKVLLPEIAGDEDRIRRFEQEAKAASALNHPNILTIHEIGTFEGRHYIATEFVDGETLRVKLVRERIPLAEVAEIAAQVAAALKAAHNANIIHRDIKPENIVIRADGLVKVLDFGLAKLISGGMAAGSDVAPNALLKTRTGMIMGTAGYMSPEQARGQPADPRTDIWSLGVMIYEMLAGRAPFLGETLGDSIAAILTADPPPLRAEFPEIPVKLESVVLKTLRKDADERYQTAAELLIALNAAANDLAPPNTASASDDFSRRMSASTARMDLTSGRVPSAVTNATNKAKYLAFAAVAALLILAVGTAWYLYFRQSNISNTPIADGVSVDSIAVLPFVNAANDPNAEYLSDGITESLINSLSQVSGLRVMSSSSVFRYKDKEQDATKIGTELNVRAILKGSVKQIGDQLVINVSLDDAKDDRRIWGDQYVRKFTDVLAVQSEIAREVSNNLRVKLSGTDERQLTKRYTESLEAYQLYLKGQYEWNKHTQADLEKAIEYYNQALEKDPNYVLAYCGLSASYGVLGDGYLQPNKAFPTAKAYAEKALISDESFAGAHSGMGAVRLYYDWDFVETERELKRALELDPNSAAAHHLYGDYLEIAGRFNDVRIERKRALELDPLSPLFNMAAGATLYFSGHTDEAIIQLENTINLEPHFVLTYQLLAQAYERKGMYDKAIEICQRGISNAENHPYLIAELGHAYAMSGQRDKALKKLAELREISKHQYVSPYLEAVIYSGLGDKDLTMEWLEKAYQDRSSFLLWLNVEPLFNSMRSDARFQDLLKRMNFPV